MVVRVTSLLACAPERLATELARPSLLLRIAAPMIVFVPAEPAELPPTWAPGAYRTRLMLGGRLSIGEHTLDVQHVRDSLAGAAGPVEVWHDAGYSDLIRRWDHRIVLEDFSGMTRYTDVVDIEAGWLTGAAVAFARAFYRFRQRRLNELVSRDFAD